LSQKSGPLVWVHLFNQGLALGAFRFGLRPKELPAER
jgi:hypothetical protein